MQKKKHIWREYGTVETGQIDYDDENEVREIKIHPPIEAQKLKIVVPKQTPNGVCYLRLGYKASKRMNIENETMKHFSEMTHKRCDQCKNRFEPEVYSSYCKECDRTLCASCTLLRLAGVSE